MSVDNDQERITAQGLPESWSRHDGSRQMAELAKSVQTFGGMPNVELPEWRYQVVGGLRASFYFDEESAKIGCEKLIANAKERGLPDKFEIQPFGTCNPVENYPKRYSPEMFKSQSQVEVTDHEP